MMWVDVLDRLVWDRYSHRLISPKGGPVIGQPEMSPMWNFTEGDRKLHPWQIDNNLDGRPPVC